MRQLKITKSITNRESTSLDKYLQEIGKVELITMEEEVELAQRIRNGDRVALEKLVRANLRFVVSVAMQCQNQGLSLPELINEGNLGLYKAAENFDETRGFKFITYAVRYIRQSILQALANVRSQDIEYNDNSLRDKPIDYHAMVVSEIKSPSDTLTEREREIVKSFFGVGVPEMTYEEIGEKFGISRERARQIKEKAIRRLRHVSKNNPVTKVERIDIDMNDYDRAATSNKVENNYLADVGNSGENDEKDYSDGKLVFNCSICHEQLNPFIEHFEGHVCNDCMINATDKDGRPVSFDMNNEGRLTAKYFDNQEGYDSHFCYVHGIKCHIETEKVRYGYKVVGRVAKDATVIKFQNHAKYQEKLSEILEQITEISTVMYENLFALACMGKWNEWDDQQPIGARIFIDEDMIRNTGDKNIDLLLEVWDKIEEVKEEILG